MAEVHQLSRPQVIDEDVLREIEDRIAAARRGEIVDIMFACNDAEGDCYWRMSDFANAWRALGALEYIKDSILRGMGER